MLIDIVFDSSITSDRRKAQEPGISADTANVTERIFLVFSLLWVYFVEAYEGS